MNPVIIIPTRLSSTRLPNKPLAMIAGQPMILHVLRRAEKSGIGPVIVASGDRKIADLINQAGGTAVMTDPNLPSGSDRVFEALEKFDPTSRFDVIINLQGDLPTIDPNIIQAALKSLNNSLVDIGTLATEIKDNVEKEDPNIVKVAVSFPSGQAIGRAIYFSRAIVPAGEGSHYHHIGIYAYRREALKNFVALPESSLEKREKLEQLRALEAGMRIDVSLVDTFPDGVDTPADLERVRRKLEL
ncbi:MAG: 3-deoxy-manno-octulosonate cytidylyltransferase [Rhodospirillaceae bacterium]|nr:3-deoxy-manno-octulosonate cytidylyltransferase [Rhodospirillaceae bacterium]